MQNPILSSRNTLYYYLGIWFIVIIFHTFLLHYSGNVMPVEAFTDSLITNLLFSAIGIGLWFPIFFSRSDDERILNTIINNIVGAIVAISFWLGLGYFFLVTLLH